MVGTTPTSSVDWHTLSTEVTLKQQQVELAQGLTDAEATARLQQFGRNELVDRGAKNPLLILWEQISDPLVVILLIAALISAISGKIPELIAILTIVVINAILGVVQEYRAERAIQALKAMAAPLVRVRRNGKVIDLESPLLVPGDIILMETGNIVPADARLVDAANLKVQEASLTGESEAVDKHNKQLDNANVPLGDRRNMVYMGTSATYGRGVGVIVNTGMNTELGRIAQLIQEVATTETPLQRRMGEVGRVMFYASLIVMGIAIGVGALEFFFSGDIFSFALINEILLESVSIAVAVVPEGLPAVVTVSLALGTQRLLRRNALIRKLPAVETLGSVTVICSDKTGTLTENRMTVKVMNVPGEAFDLTPIMRKTVAKGHYFNLDSNMEGLLLLAGSMVNDSIVERVDREDVDFVVQGDPTETAITLAAARFGLEKNHLDDSLVRIDEVPFSSERKYMTTIHEYRKPIPTHHELLEDVAKVFEGYPYAVFTKGAPDRVVGLCSAVWDNGRIVPIKEEDFEGRIERANAKLAGEGLRVLAIAFSLHKERPTAEQSEKDLVFIGLVGIIDPPRAEVKDAVAVCKTAGIRPVMITGDHPITARAIAKDLGIIDSDTARAVIGNELEAMSDAELREVVKTVSVFARVSPEHKLRIVDAMKANNNIVAMTGDGVNDAPALKRADIGVAMAITGTDVSKEAADMVILDDNFATIVSAAEEGRTIYDNVRRFIKYLLASNTGELLTLLTMQAIPGLGLPFTTLQILWMNLITDGVPALALGVEVPERNSMKRPPYAPDESVFGRGLGRHILIVGLVLFVTAFTIGYWAYSNQLKASNGELAWKSMVFIVLTLAQMGHAYGLRSHTNSVFSMNIMGNRFLLVALVVTTLIQLSTLYIPLFQNIFGTEPLTVNQLLICLALSTGVFWAVELEKLLIRRGVLK